MQKQPARIYLFLSAVEGLLALAWILTVQSDADTRFFGGLSKARLLLAGAVVFLSILLGLSALLSYRNPNWLERGLARLDERLLDQGSLGSLLIFLVYGLILGGGSILMLTRIPADGSGPLSTWLGPHLPAFVVVFRRALPLLLWGWMLVLGAILLLSIQYWKNIRERVHWKAGDFAWIAAVWLMLILVIADWLAMIFRLRVLQSIPGYYWKLNPKPVTVRDGFFILLCAVLTGVVYWIFKNPRQILRNLLLICVLGFAVQAGMGVVEGQGIESLRLKYFSSYHRSYAGFASHRTETILESIARYEEIYGKNMFPRTKPPGVISLNIAIERLANWIHPQPNDEGRYAQLTEVEAWLFPIISVWIVFLIFYFSRKLHFPGQPLQIYTMAPLLFIFAPNIVLIALFLDQAIYPALFLAGAFLIILMVSRQSLLIAFLAGVYLYLSVFMSFSMLPLIGFAVLYSGFTFWINPSWKMLGSVCKTLGLFIGGIALFYFLFRIFLNYDFFVRYQVASSVTFNINYVQRGGIAGQPGASPFFTYLYQTISAAYLNNVEFAAAAGIPFYVLFLIQGVRSLLGLLRRKAETGQLVSGAFFATFLALNIYGLNRGESARLWMFWVPVVMLMAIYEILPLLKRRPSIFYLLLAVQIMTTILTYKLQDLKT